MGRELVRTTILILGLGNPILGDDGVGIQVVRMLKDRIQTRKDLDFKELSVGGLRLVEEMLGYQKVFLIDSIESSPTQIGSIREFSVEDFKETQQASAPHVTNFATAFELYKRLEPGEIPESVRIFTIGINPMFTFAERLSPLVEKAASELVDLVASEISQA
jgi:hydrogenase maturation protease